MLKIFSLYIDTSPKTQFRVVFEISPGHLLDQVISAPEYWMLNKMIELTTAKELVEKTAALKFLKEQLEDCCNALRYEDWIKSEEFFKIRRILIDDMEKRAEKGGYKING